MKYRMLSLLFLFSAVMFGAEKAGPQWRWHEEKALNRTTRYFRIPVQLESKPKSAPVTIGVDDVGELFVNGRRIAGNIVMPPRTFHLEKYLKQGKNVIALKIDNHIAGAGLIFSGEILLNDGKTSEISSRGKVLSSDAPAPDWTKAGFNDSEWKDAAVKSLSSQH